MNAVCQTCHDTESGEQPADGEQQLTRAATRLIRHRIYSVKRAHVISESSHLTLDFADNFDLFNRFRGWLYLELTNSIFR